MSLANQVRKLSPNKLVATLIACGIMWIIYMYNEAPAVVSDVKRLTKPFVDMHVHSTESDGDRSAEEQIALAATNEIPHMWITDHDYIRPLERTREIQAYAKGKHVTVGFGVEITVDWMGKEHHLLGYFPDALWATSALSPAMIALQDACAQVKASRENRNTLLVEHLNAKLGGKDASVYFTTPSSASSFSKFTVSDVTAWAAKNAGLVEPASLGRPHFLKYLTKVKGVTNELVFGPRTGEGKGTILANGTVLWDAAAAGATGTTVEALMHTAVLGAKGIKFEPLPIVTAIKMIKAAGGRAVVAHIPTLGPDWLDRFATKLADLKTAGLWGIEGYSSEVDATNHEAIVKLAGVFKLVVTGGSDNHGTLKVYAGLGDVHRLGSPRYDALMDWFNNGNKLSNDVQDGL